MARLIRVNRFLRDDRFIGLDRFIRFARDLLASSDRPGTGHCLGAGNSDAGYQWRCRDPEGLLYHVSRRADHGGRAAAMDPVELRAILPLTD